AHHPGAERRVDRRRSRSLARAARRHRRRPAACKRPAPLGVRWREETVAGHAGVRLHLRRIVDVDPGAQPIMLLHGLGVGGAVWQAFARRLLPHLAALAPDLRGYADSDAPPGGYAPIDYARDVAEVLSAEGAMPLVGHSLGALVALETAALDPARVPWL